MAEVSCVILTEGVAPDGDLLRRAQEKGVNLLGAGQDTFDTAARLSGALAAG
ncbi:MAG: DRTGG domain-containing protein [Flavonifractor plautii]